jgi:hypothetical protein
MSTISEFQAALRVKLSPFLLRWFTQYSPKNDKVKLSFEEKDGIYYFDEDELDNFNVYLNSPWPKPSKGTRPTIPAGIKHEIMHEAFHCCPICRTNAGELAHIEPVVKTLNNHPNNLIYLCPNHHTVYDYGHKYNNVSKEDVLTYKKALLTFQTSQWKLQGNVIDSYISAINMIGRIKEIESEILKCVNSKEFEKLFEQILNKIEKLKPHNEKASLTTEIIESINKQEYTTNKEKAYTFVGARSQIVETIKKESHLDDCPLCNGKGSTDYYDICPACHGEGLLSSKQIQNIDFNKYDLVNCPLCEGKGHTSHYDPCPPCGGDGVLSKEQIQNIDFDKYDLVNCPLCEGKGHTSHYDPCPSCGGDGVLSKEQIQNIGFDKYDLVNCPLCEGKGHTSHYDPCPPCGGDGVLSKEQIQNIGFDDY